MLDKARKTAQQPGHGKTRHDSDDDPDVNELIVGELIHPCFPQALRMIHGTGAHIICYTDWRNLPSEIPCKDHSRFPFVTSIPPTISETWPRNARRGWKNSTLV